MRRRLTLLIAFVLLLWLFAQEQRVAIRQVEPRVYTYYFPMVVKPQSKKGLVIGYGYCQDYALVSAVWGHTYNTQPPICPDVESVPVIDMPENANDVLGGNSAWIIGYNEPDRRGATPRDAAMAWRIVEERFPDKWLVAPGTVQENWTWLVDFYNAYVTLYGEPPRLDALNLHAYCYYADECIAYLRALEEIGNRWGVSEIWVTEFGLPYGDCVSDSQMAEGRKVIAEFERDNQVMRYSWYENRVKGDEIWIPPHWCGLGLVDFTTGALTPFGAAYK